MVDVMVALLSLWPQEEDDEDDYNEGNKLVLLF